MDWLILLVAGLMEIGWAIGLRYTDGYTKFWPSAATAVALVASMALLSFALRTIPVGTGYAVWTGVGAVGVAVIGMLMLGEPRNPLRIACILLIVLGIIGLKFFGDAKPA